MALVVFLRGVNVGGNKTFKPSQFAKELESSKVAGSRGGVASRSTVANREKTGSHGTVGSSRAAQSLQVISHGAAGTFIVHGKIGAKALRDEILRRLPFDAEVMICTGDELVEMVRSKPFGSKPAARDVKWYVCVLRNPLRSLPRLPIESPTKKDWQVRVLRVTGPFALCEWRKRGRTFIYPNEVVEQTFGVPVTTRNWNTITSVCDSLLRSDA